MFDVLTELSFLLANVRCVPPVEAPGSQILNSIPDVIMLTWVA